MALLAVVLFSIFLILGLLHIGWAFGFSGGFEDAIPKDEAGKPVLHPGKIDCFVVGVGLLLFGLFYLIKLELIAFQIPAMAVSIAKWIIPVIFLLRSIGDFKYVGFSKKVKSTAFARKDTMYYSPLCMLIAVIGFILGIG